jgi:hypothetical protein
MLTYAITQGVENGFYYVSAAIDALPPHWRTRDGYLTIEDAKSAHPRDWQNCAEARTDGVVSTAVEY